MFSKTLHSANTNSNDTTALPTVVDGGTPPRNRKLIMQQVQNDYNNTKSNIDEELQKSNEGNVNNMSKFNNSQDSISSLAERLDNKLHLTTAGEEQQNTELQVKQQQQQNNQNILLNDDALSNGCNSKGEMNCTGNGGNGVKTDINHQLNANSCKKERLLKNGFVSSCNDSESINVNEAITPNTHTPVSDSNPPAQIVNPSPAPPVQQTPTKKEKLGGFLPNGCIFPRFTKNNKYKDKDKDKEKEKDTKTKDKEKNVLLSALKKSKDKKLAGAAAANNDENNTSSNTNTAVANNCFNQSQQTSCNKQQKNCLPQLECGVQKLDFNNHHPPHNSENSSTNTTKNNASNKNNTSNKNSGVGVH